VLVGKPPVACVQVVLCVEVLVVEGGRLAVLSIEVLVVEDGRLNVLSLGGQVSAPELDEPEAGEPVELVEDALHALERNRHESSSNPEA
jgi:hypothetical protein